MTSGRSSEFSMHRLPDWLALAAAFIFISLAAYRIQLPGLYYDELAFVNAAQGEAVENRPYLYLCRARFLRQVQFCLAAIGFRHRNLFVLPRQPAKPMGFNPEIYPLGGDHSGSARVRRHALLNFAPSCECPSPNRGSYTEPPREVARARIHVIGCRGGS